MSENKRDDIVNLVSPVLQPTHEIMLMAADLVDYIMNYCWEDIEGDKGVHKGEGLCIEETFHPHSLREALCVRANALKKLYESNLILKAKVDSELRLLTLQAVGLKSISESERV